MSTIASITGRRVWDSRGNPTVEVDVTLTSGVTGRAIAPAGASRGKREAIDLRDGGAGLRGMNVSRALTNINGSIAQALVGMPIADQSSIDARLLSLDSSSMKSSVGGNAMVATSLASLHAAAAEAKQPLWQHVATRYAQTPILPLPEIQIFGGGAHAGRRVDIQDFMIMVPGASDFDEVMEITSEVYFAAGDIMASRGLAAGVADEGGWWPLFETNEQALETLMLAIEKAGEKPGDRVVISLDVAASEFYRDGHYHLTLDNQAMCSDEFINLLGQWISDYPIVSIEDPLAEDDTEAMIKFTRQFGDQLQIIGDDYLVTNANHTAEAIAAGACNAVLIKPNQAGTVTEAIATYTTATEAGWGAVVSARSGETEDVSISHFATGLGCGQLKVGSFQRSERMSKWNECLRIQDEIGSSQFAAGNALIQTWWAARQ